VQSPWTQSAFSILFCLSACASDDGEAAGGDGTSAAGTAAVGSDGSDGVGGSGQVDGGSSDGAGPALEPARGITISAVDANPGVAIPVAIDGQWVEGPDRRAQIPKGRNTAFRVYVDVDEAIWVQREIEAHFTVINPEGEEEVYIETVDIGSDSSLTSLQSNFLFGVLAEFMVPGAEFRVELYEAGGDYESLPAVESPPTATEGDALIGIEPSEQNMKIVLVPVDYSFGGCTAAVDTSDEVIGQYEDAMFQMNGLETIELAVHTPITVSDLDLTDPNDFFSFLNRIVALRASEAPDPNVYYYGLFDNCGVCIGNGGGCLLGVAPGTPGSSMGEAGSRAAIGTQFLSGSEVGIDTFVHEIGHSQGRAHVACPGGGSAGPDPSYPHEDGGIGVWGFGVTDFQIRNSSTHFDYMGYCNPTWVSDWQWKATYERIRELSSWDAADMADAMDRSSVLMGSVNSETGESHWWVDRGWVEPEALQEFTRLRYMVDGEVGAETPVAVMPWSEGPWVTVRAPLNAPEDYTTLELDLPTAHLVVPRTAVKALAIAE